MMNRLLFLVLLAVVLAMECNPMVFRTLSTDSESEASLKFDSRPASQELSVAATRVIQAATHVTMSSASINDHSSKSEAGSIATRVSELDGSAGTILLLDSFKPYTFLTSFTFPTNTHLIVSKGALIHVAADQTLTIDGPFDAGLYEVFAGAGNVVFGKGATLGVPTEWFGDPGDGKTDGTHQIQRAINSIQAGGKLIISAGIHAAQGLFLWRDDIQVDCRGWLKPVANKTVPVITIGANTAGQTVLTRRLTGNLKVGDDVTRNFLLWNKVTGINIVCLYEARLGIDTTGLEIGLGLHGKYTPGGGASHGSVAYNSFFLGNMSRNKIGIEIDPRDSKSWCNENKFFNGTFHIYSNNFVKDAWSIHILSGNGHLPNNNIFYSPALEGCAGAFYCNGVYNKIIDARLELITKGQSGTDYAEPYIKFGPRSLGNTLHVSHSRSASLHHMISKGSATRVNDKVFAIDGDLQEWFSKGQQVLLNIGGVEQYSFVTLSSFSGTKTQISIDRAVISDDPSNVKAFSMTQVPGAKANHVVIANFAIPSVAYSEVRMEPNQRRIHLSSSFTIGGINDAHPPLVLEPGKSATDTAFSINSFTGEALHSDFNGNLATQGKLTAGNGLGVGNATTGDVTNTSRTKKIQIFDINGAPLGYIQVYAGP